MRAAVGFLLRRGPVLAVFPLLKLAAVIAEGVVVNTVDVWTFGVLAVIVYAVIAWFAWQRRIVSIWAMTLIMLYEGSGALLTGLRNLGTAPVLGAVSVAVAIYLVLGALTVFSSRRGGR